MSNKRWGTILAVSLVSWALVACQGGSSGGGSKDEGDEGPPQSGGSISVAQLAEPRTLDPAVMANSLGANSLVGDSLFGQLLINAPETGEFEYMLAESLETSDGGLTWTLKLRDGLTFSDGTPLDASAVQSNWSRLTESTASTPNRSAASIVASMNASGQTLEFTLTEAIPQFPSSIVSTSMNWIASPAALQAGPAAFDANPIGAGPFVLESWTRQGEMVLARNPNYWDSPRPYLDELVLTVNVDDNQRLSSMETGGSDAAVSASAATTARAEEQGLEAMVAQLNGGTLYLLNTQKAPFTDVRAREAIFKALDIEAVIAASYDGFGTVPETLFYEDSPFYEDVQLQDQDKERAQELLDELASEGTPLEFTITAVQSDVSIRTTEAVQTQLNAFDNVEVNVEVFDTASAISKMGQRSFQMIPYAIIFDAPDPTVYQALHSGSPANLAGIDDPQLDAALEAGRRAMDLEDQREAYSTVAQRLSDLYATLFYSRSSTAFLHTTRVNGAQPYGINSMPTDRLWVSD